MPPKTKKKKARYILQLLNEHSLESLFSLRMSRWGTMLVVIIATLIASLLICCLIYLSPLKNNLPGFVRHETSIEIVDNALRLDSLERAINLRDNYLNNFKDILLNHVEIAQIDSALTTDSVWLFPADSLHDLSAKSTQFITDYEREGGDKLHVFNSHANNLSGFLFYSPIKGGVVATPFHPTQGSWGITLRTPAQATVAATLAGTVVSTYYTIDSGYILELLHKDGFLSKYINCSSLIKRVGDEVSEGDPIAFIDYRKVQPEEALFGFELWERGEAVDPQLYIKFE